MFRDDSHHSGHDHHAMHHLFPQVPHYRLRQVWSEQAIEMVAKGVKEQVC